MAGERRRSLVTGAARGLGLGLCEALVERGDEVLAVCRTATPELAALDVEVIDGIELTSDEAVANLPQAVGPGGVDLLFCNAGINIDAPGLKEIEVDALMKIYDVNALGAVRVVLSLLGRLNGGAKILLMGTGRNSLNLGAVPSTGNYGYRMSKSALVSFGGGVARDMRDQGVAVAIVDPGPVATDLLREVADQGRTSYDPDDAPTAAAIGRKLVARAEELTLADSPSWQETPDGRPILSLAGA
jgi:NAD(P)-dependent dehydrogenase (short-subunit alcohol dehydrogenase family)